MTGSVYFESEAATVEIIDGLAHITPHSFPHQFVVTPQTLAEFCVAGLAAFDQWEAAEAGKLVADAPIFERRHERPEPAEH